MDHKFDVPTVRGMAQADLAARTYVYEALRQGLDDVAHGRTRPAREAFDAIRRKHGIPR